LNQDLIGVIMRVIVDGRKGLYKWWWLLEGYCVCDSWGEPLDLDLDPKSSQFAKNVETVKKSYIKIDDALYPVEEYNGSVIINEVK